jgi:hypothetical protein
MKCPKCGLSLNSKQPHTEEICSKMVETMRGVTDLAVKDLFGLDAAAVRDVAKYRQAEAISSITVTEMLAVVVEEYLHEYEGYDEEDFIDFVVSQTHGGNGTGLLNAMPSGSEGLIAFYEKRIAHLRDWVARTNKEDERDAKVGRK